MFSTRSTGTLFGPSASILQETQTNLIWRQKIKKRKYTCEDLLIPPPPPPLLLQVCEHLGAGPVEEEAWSVYLLGAQRSQRLRIRESSEAFSTELHPGSEFHSTFLHMLRDYTSPAGLDRSRKSHYQFVDTVQQLLCATQPLTYS